MTYNDGIRAAAALMAQYANGNHEDRNRAAAVLGLLREEPDDGDAMRDHGKACEYCGEPVNSLAANPGLWPIRFPHSDGTGITRIHHHKCLSVKLARLEQLEAAAPTIKGE